MSCYGVEEHLACFLSICFILFLKSICSRVKLCKTHTLVCSHWDYFLQGLNPLMFMFALAGNITYVGRYEILIQNVFLSLCWLSINQLCIQSSWERHERIKKHMGGGGLCSILVRSTEWSQLKPNLPWLVDAGVCVLLDTFVSSHWDFSLKSSEIHHSCFPASCVVSY